jgi:hypothetical protein
METAVDSFFIVFVHRLDELGPPIAYRGDGGNVVVYDTRPEAEDAAIALTATNKNSNSSFTVTEFHPLASFSAALTSATDLTARMGNPDSERFRPTPRTG